MIFLCIVFFILLTFSKVFSVCSRVFLEGENWALHNEVTVVRDFWEEVADFWEEVPAL